MSPKTLLPNLKLSLQFALQPTGTQDESARRHRSALPRHFVARCLRHALQLDGEITVRLVGAEEGQALNHNYRQKKHATNVLTFDYAKNPLVMADLVLCAPVVAQEARAQGKTLKAHYAHLLVHGCLHAQGWDHETSLSSAKAMEAREVQILAGLGFKNPHH